ncbi:MAG: hypothetical protein ACK56F_16260, partial [bacterium]
AGRPHRAPAASSRASSTGVLVHRHLAWARTGQLGQAIEHRLDPCAGLAAAQAQATLQLGVPGGGALRQQLWPGGGINRGPAGREQGPILQTEALHQAQGGGRGPRRHRNGRIGTQGGEQGAA